MGTIMSLMDIAQQALMANQEALNVTSNNVANQNTAGYTREVVNFQSVDAAGVVEAPQGDAPARFWQLSGLREEAIQRLLGRRHLLGRLLLGLRRSPLRQRAR